MRDYNTGLTEKLMLRVTPQMAELLRGIPNGYNNYIRELIVKDLEDKLNQILKDAAKKQQEATNASP
jgi:hypothetical protein